MPMCPLSSDALWQCSSCSILRTCADSHLHAARHWHELVSGQAGVRQSEGGGRSGQLGVRQKGRGGHN